ncbi:MAG TPA: type I 3-dehydroquinate dehydratase [Thermoanaerobaculia bacterium]|nr:type I 3-dehydroquinate dehydratase [Thermoanaerobaculia bacterium]
MKLFVTIAEETPESAVGAIRRLTAGHDGVEVRVERFSSYDPAMFRAATAKPIILTKRGGAQSAAGVAPALAAGIDLVDVEYGPELGWIRQFRNRVVLSHHDFDGMPDVEPLLRDMRSHGCVHTKLAVTPRSLEDNFELLRHQRAGTTLIGMGERGLFSRILAPFLGSELAFVSPSEDRVAAPGQITLERALAIYGDRREAWSAGDPARGSLAIFAIAGNPAGHSLSPSIHNPLFRSKVVRAVYTIASVESFGELEAPFLDDRIRGLSITAPFKEAAFAFARKHGARIGENAQACQAVNTLVNLNDGVLADNTDVDGFTQILSRLCGRDRKTVALVGAGGTARAALVALDRAGMQIILYNRGEERGRGLAASADAAFEPLESLTRFDGEIVINTLPPGADVAMPLRPGMTLIEAAYGATRAHPAGVEIVDGLELLHAQAMRQHELFMKVFDES